MLFRQESAALGTVRAVLLESGSKTEQLFDAVLEGRVSSDDEAMSLLYGTTEEAQSRYNSLKIRLKEKIIQGILIADANGMETSDRSQAYIECQKKWAAAMTLFAKGAENAAAELAEQLLRRSRKFEFTELVISVSHRLRHYYSFQYGKAKKYEEYRALNRAYLEVWAAEKEAEDVVNDLAATYKPTRESRLELADVAERAYQNIASLLASSESYSLHFSGRILLLNSKMYRGDYAAAAEICKDAVTYFEKRKYNCNVPSQLFNYQLIVCQIQLKQYEEGRNTIRKQQAAFEPGTWNWFKFQELLYLLSMHTAHYDAAFQLQELAIQSKNFEKMPEMIQESWRIYEAYSWFLVKTGHIAKPTGARTYKTGKFLNEVPTYAKDKRSANVPVLIAQVLHALADGKTDVIIDRAEALAKYTSRYLKDDNQFRSNCFMNMLLQLPAGKMHRVAVMRKAEKVVARLAEHPIQIADQPFELEIIPYETLWGMVLNLLSPKPTGLEH